MSRIPFLLTAALVLALLIACGDDESAPGELLINEVNSKSGDFVEIFNPSGNPYTIAAGAWTLRDNNDTNIFAIPALTIPARGFLVINCAVGDPIDASLNTPFGLGSADSARLYKNGALVDSVSWTSDVLSYGRYPDGSASWMAMEPTPGGANSLVQTTNTVIKINEVRSTGDYDFVELINTSGSPFLLATGKWTFKDNKDGNTMAIPETTIPANGYLVLLPSHCVTNTNGLSLPAAFALNAEDQLFGLGRGDAARLYFEGRQADSTSWAAADHADSWGRQPNGTGNFVNGLTATPGAANP